MTKEERTEFEKKTSPQDLHTTAPRIVGKNKSRKRKELLKAALS